MSDIYGTPVPGDTRKRGINKTSDGIEVMAYDTGRIHLEGHDNGVLT